MIAPMLTRWQTKRDRFEHRKQQNEQPRENCCKTNGAIILCRNKKARPKHCLLSGRSALCSIDKCIVCCVAMNGKLLKLQWNVRTHNWFSLKKYCRCRLQNNAKCSDPMIYKRWRANSFIIDWKQFALTQALKAPLMPDDCENVEHATVIVR